LLPPLQRGQLRPQRLLLSLHNLEPRLGLAARLLQTLRRQPRRLGLLLRGLVHLRVDRL
jgi:hypothetical protein